MTPSKLTLTLVPVLTVLALLQGCTTLPAPAPETPPQLDAKAQAKCAALAGTVIPGAALTLPGIGSGPATIDSAVYTRETVMTLVDRGPTPAAMINPATPNFCKVLGHIAPVDPTAPNINFQVNLPESWNGRSVQYGGGGFNGVLISGQGLLPAARYEAPAPLALGYVTVGTDSGHQNQPGQPPQVFALNDEALLNFAHAAYPKVREVSVQLMQRHYGKAPEKLYFFGSSEGGREGLTLAQRYPGAFDGIFSRVPVIHWTGLQHVGLRDGLATTNGGWMRPAQVKLVHDNVLAVCDTADGLFDGLVSDPLACRKRFDATKLRCTGEPGDGCLTDAQIKAVQTLHSAYRFDFELANGLREYPGRGPSGENTPTSGPTGGWNAWWLGSAPPAFPPVQANGIAWFYGAGAIQYFYARNPQLDLRNYKVADHKERVLAVSALMDSTNPDLSAFAARGGKLLMLENMADYAQSPYAGIAYYESVRQKMGSEKVDGFMRLYTAPGVDHVGTGGPANADFLGALVQWVEKGQAPGGLTLAEQTPTLPFKLMRTRPACTWPLVPRFKGGVVNDAANFDCLP
jgi:feruloyl esterase